MNEFERISLEFDIALENSEYMMDTIYSVLSIEGNNIYLKESSGELDEEHIGKKAFFESVKEYTLWDMVHTLGFENFSKGDIDFTATKYARGTI